jgi:hypothetical protein
MPDAPALPSYLTGDAPPPAAPPPAGADLPALPAYLTGMPEPPTSADLVKAKGRPALGAYLAAQGAPSGLNPGMRQEKPPDASFLTAAQAAATNAFGVPLAGAAETFRDWAAQHPTLAAVVAGPQAAQRAQAVPQGLTAELKAKAEQQRQDFLAAHPGTGGAAAEFATELGVNALPMLAGVPSAARSLAKGYSGVGGLANVATAGKGSLAGATITAPLGYASAYGSPTGERLSAAAHAALYGASIGAVGGMAALDRPPLPDYLTGGIAEAVPRTAAATAHMAKRFPGATMGERPLGSGAQLAGVPAAAAAPLGAPVQGHVQLDATHQGLGDETMGAMQQAVHQALDRAAPGRAALGEDGSVSVAADNEAHLHETLAAAQAHLAQHPLVATLPDGSQVHIPIEVTYGLSPEAAGPDALAGRVLAARPALPAVADGEAAGAGGVAPLAARPGELSQGYAVPHEGLAGAAPGDAAGAAEGPGGQAHAGGPALQAGALGSAGADLARGEAALAGRPVAEAPGAAGSEAAAPPPPAAGAVAAELHSGEAGFAANPFASSAAQRSWRQFYPLRRSFVNQEAADRQAATFHETDLMRQFPDPELRKQMTLAVERNDPMQPAAEQFVRDHPQGGQAALDEIERQRQQGHVNFKGLQDLGFMPKDLPEVPDYIRHQWEPVKGAPARAEVTPQPTENPITSVLQAREFPTLGTGLRAGRTPTTLDYATVVRRGDEDFSHTLALHRLMQDVSEIRTMSDGQPAYLRMKGRDPADLQRIGQAGYQDMSGVPLMQRAIPGEGTLYVHKNLYDNIAPLIKRTDVGPIGAKYDFVTGTAKQMLLGFSLFHPAELTIQNALQRGVTPALWEGLKRGFGAPGLNQLTQRMGWGNLERETWMQAAREGVNFPSPETDTNMIQIQKTLNGLALRAGLMDTKAGAAVVRTLGDVAASPHEAMFPGYMAPLKVMVQTINRDKLMRLRNGEDMAMGLGGFLQRGRIRALSDDEAIAGVTAATNNAFGGQSRALFRSRFMNDPTYQKWFSRLFLAPDWFTSGSKLMGEPLSPNPVTRALGINMYMRLAWQTAVGLNLANYALTRAFSPTGRGHFMIDNEPGKETQLQTGPNEFMNVMKLQRELPDVIGKERVSNMIGAVAHAGPQGQALEWLRQPHGPWPGADEPVATSHFTLSDPSWHETPFLSTIGNKVNPLPNAALGELSGHYASGYPTDLTKEQEAADRRGTTQLKQGELKDRTMTAVRPFMPIPGSKLVDTQEPLTAGNIAKQLLVPFQLSKGLSFYTALPQLTDAFRRGDQEAIDRDTAILMSHIDRRDPEQAAMGEIKVQKLLKYAQDQARRYPQPLTATGKAEVATQ